MKILYFLFAVFIVFKLNDKYHLFYLRILYMEFSVTGSGQQIKSFTVQENVCLYNKMFMTGDERVICHTIMPFCRFG